MQTTENKKSPPPEDKKAPEPDNKKAPPPEDKKAPEPDNKGRDVINVSNTARRETAIIPRGLESLWTLANRLARSDLLPGHLTDKGRADAAKRVANVFWVLQCGAEVGCTPTQSIMNITPINGNPTMWGDMVIGLVRASGKAKYITETMEGTTKESLVAVCSTQRRDTGEVIERRFTYEDAKDADLLGKDNYRKYLKRMLQMRARSWCLRDAYPDVLKGIMVREEVEDFAGVTIEGEARPVNVHFEVPEQDGESSPDAGTSAPETEESERETADQPGEADQGVAPAEETQNKRPSPESVAAQVIGDLEGHNDIDSLDNAYALWEANIENLPDDFRKQVNSKYQSLREGFAS